MPEAHRAAAVDDLDEDPFRGPLLPRYLVLLLVAGLVLVPIAATVLGGFKDLGELRTNPFGSRLTRGIPRCGWPRARSHRPPARQSTFAGPTRLVENSDGQASPSVSMPGCPASGHRAPSIAIHAAFGTQILLGIATVMSSVAIWLAALHQAVGALLVACTVWGANQAGRPR